MTHPLSCHLNQFGKGIVSFRPVLVVELVGILDIPLVLGLGNLPSSIVTKLVLQQLALLQLVKESQLKRVKLPQLVVRPP